MYLFVFQLVYGKTGNMKKFVSLGAVLKDMGGHPAEQEKYM